LAGILREPLNLTNLAIEAKELAHIIVFSIKGCKDTARSGADMRRLTRSAHCRHRRCDRAVRSRRP
jgi:hypothetical protein